jgi:hypothetical protein
MYVEGLYYGTGYLKQTQLSKPNSWGGSIGKIRHTHANIIFKGTVQGKQEQLARKSDTKF